MLLGWALLWRYGAAFVFEGPASVEGYGWPGYVNNAWMVWHGQDVGYDLFRLPLHGWMVGAWGEALGGYVDGAVAVSSLSMGLAVAAAGLAARALGGPWAGGLAAVLVPLSPYSADAARWANNYPAQAGLGGAALALAAAAVRWPSAGLALCGGVVGGLAWGVDGRAGVMALAAAALTPLAFAERPAWKTALVPLLFAAGLLVGPASARALHVATDPLPPFVEKVEFQRHVALRWVKDTRKEALIAACADEPPRELPSVEAMQRPCAAGLLRHNAEAIVPLHLPLGAPLSAALALCALLPGRQGWRGSLRALAWAGAALVPLVVEALWVPLPHRYVVPRVVALVVLAPVGIARLISTFGWRASWLVGPACVGVLAWAWSTDQPQRARWRAFFQDGHNAERQQAIRATQAQLAAAPGPLLDCSAQYVQTALLPDILGPEPPLLRVLEGQRCAAWILEAPEGAYLAADANLSLRVRQGSTAFGEVRFGPDRLAPSGWVAVVDHETFQLWRRETPP